MVPRDAITAQAHGVALLMLHWRSWIAQRTERFYFIDDRYVRRIVTLAITVPPWAPQWDPAEDPSTRVLPITLLHKSNATSLRKSSATSLRIFGPDGSDLPMLTAIEADQLAVAIMKEGERIDSVSKAPALGRAAMTALREDLTNGSI